MPDRAWNFRKMSPGEMSSNPMEGEFFTGRDPAGRLVRETLQNSLDEKLTDEIVKVRFALHRDNPVEPENARIYLEGLYKHIEASAGRTEEQLRLATGNEPMEFAVIEDFNTKGLIGSIDQFVDWEGEPAEFNNFYWFFRNVGRTGKDSSKAGSWGVGKWSSLTHRR